MLDHLTYGTFIFFGLFSLLGGLFVVFFGPETRGLTLEEMDVVFSDQEGLAVADQQRQNEIVDHIGLTAYSQEKPSKVIEDEKNSPV